MRPLPPGLAGYVAGEQQGMERDRSNLQSGLGIFQIQNMMRQAALEEQMHPLKLAALKRADEEARLMNGILGQYMAARGAGGPAGGPGGMSGPAAMAAGAATGDVGPTATNAARIGQPQMGGGALGVGLGLPPDIEMALLHPKLKELGKVQAEAYKPTPEMRNLVARGVLPGTPQWNAELGTRFTPQGAFSIDASGGVTTDPRFVSSIGDIEGAKQKEQARYDMKEVTGVGRMSRLDEFNRFSARNPLQGPEASAVSASVNAMFPPAAQAAAAAEGASIRQRELQPGGGGMIPSSRVLGYVPTEAEKAAETATAAGRAKSGVDFENAVLESGRSARNNLTQLQILAPNLDKLPTGPLFNTMLTGAALFKQFGIDVGELGKNVGPAQAAEGVLNRMALAVRNPSGGEGMPGAMSDQDRNYLMRTIPNLNKVPDGNRLLIKILSSLEQRKIDEASIVNKMQAAKYGSNEIRDALAQYANRNSLTAGLR